MLKNMACYKIKDYVAANRLKPGDKLPTERDLALTLGVSRPVIREALGTLEALGYIYKKRGKGIFVKEADLSSLFQEMLFLWSNIDNQSDNLLEFRIILEQAAVGQIVDRAGAGELKLDRITGLIEEAERAPLSKKEFAKHEYNYHRELLSLTGNPMFIQLTDVINKYFQMIATKNMDNDSTVGVAESIQDHRAIVELLKRKDKNGAAGKIRDHLMKPLMAK
jgi:GntR family transcriptional repressor for pyruvate dehydrogenase complex